MYEFLLPIDKFQGVENHLSYVALPLNYHLQLN